MSATTDPETGEIVRSGSGIRFPGEIHLPWQPMDQAQAEQITIKITGYAKSICYLVRSAHEGQAHLALGFDTWGDYCDELLGLSRQRAQQLIDHADKLDLTADITGLAQDVIDLLTERTTRGIRKGEVQALASTAVATAGPDATPEEKVAAIRQTFTESKTTTYQPSPEAAPSADGDRTGEGGSAPVDPGATSPGQNAEPPAGDADGSAEQANATADSDADDLDPSLSAEGSGSPHDLHPTETLRVRGSKAVVGARKLLAISPEGLAAVVLPEDVDAYRSLASEMEAWGQALKTALTQPLRSVQ